MHQNTVCGTEKHNKCTFCNVLEEVSCPVMFYFFMCLIDMNKFEKHLRPMKHVYSLCSMLNMVSLIINIYCIKHLCLSMPILIRVL